MRCLCRQGQAMPSKRSGGGGGSGGAQQESAGAGASDSAAADVAGFAVDAERGMSMTLAADLLGMPSLPGEFNAKVLHSTLPATRARVSATSF